MQDTTKIEKLNDAEIEKLMGEVHADWKLSEDKKIITREFKFKGYYKTINFVNVLAWIAQEHKHHPDLEVNFGRVLVNFSTHDVDGLSMNDFDCVKKVDAL